jgi:protein-S-isoprenylcysteine O-methyltransferase Ste14
MARTSIAQPTVHVEPRSSRYFMVTKEELEQYASVSDLGNVLLTLIGIGGGFFASCLLVLADAAATNRERFVDLSWMSSIVTVIFAVLLWYTQKLRKTMRQAWDPSHNDREPESTPTKSSGILHSR